MRRSSAPTGLKRASARSPPGGSGSSPGARFSGERLDYLAGKEVTHERMEELGPVILMDGKKFERGLTNEGRKVTERIHAGPEGRGPGSPRIADTTGLAVVRRPGFPTNGSLARNSGGRPRRCPFRGLLGIHSRCGPHGR